MFSIMLIIFIESILGITLGYFAHVSNVINQNKHQLSDMLTTFSFMTKLLIVASMILTPISIITFTLSDSTPYIVTLIAVVALIKLINHDEKLHTLLQQN